MNPVTAHARPSAYAAGLMSALSPEISVRILDALPTATALLDLDQPGWPLVWANAAFCRLTGIDPRAGSAGWLDFADPQVEGLGGEGALARLVSQSGPASWLPRRGSAELAGHSVPLIGAGRRHLLLTLDELPGAPVARLPLSPRWSSAQRLDAVTSLPLREPFEEMLRRDWGMARRAQRRVSVILFRIDALDSYRTLFGRHAADSCLKRIASVLTGSLRRAGDYCARFGEDCLATLVDNDEEPQVRMLAAQLEERVRRLGIHHPRIASRFVSVSWTVASAVPDGHATAAGLMEEAEAQLASLPPAPAAAEA